MIFSKYFRSICCGLLMLAVVGQASAVEIPWWGVFAGFAGTSVVSCGAGAFFYSMFDKQKPVKVNYPDQELYEVDSETLKNASGMRLRREQRKLAEQVEFLKVVEQNFVGCVNKRSSDVRMIQETLKGEFDSRVSDDDIELLRSLAKEHIDTSDGDKKAELFVQTYRAMKDQASKVKKLRKEYKKNNPGA